MKRFYSNGKLLLSGEYVVLDGALSLGIPTKFGQELLVKSQSANNLNWQSYNHKGEIWFEATFEINKMANTISCNTESQISIQLVKILNIVLKINPSFKDEISNTLVRTSLDFPNNWGLGSSSTLINNISNWANVDAYKILELTFGGSGYDIACAQHNGPISYQLTKQGAIINEVDFNPSFKDQLYFVHLNKKQNSRDAIAHYESNSGNKIDIISKINAITEALLSCQNLKQFEALLQTHEQIISSTINLKPIKDQLFSDFDGAIKSLGAWGGDFILVTSNIDPSAYFKQKGFNTILPYTDMILK